MRVIIKNNDIEVGTYNNIRFALVVTNSGETIQFSSLKYDLIHINENTIQLFALVLERK